MLREEATKHIKAAAKIAIDAGYSSDIVDACALAVRALEQEPKWVPLSERLPDENEELPYYLVTQIAFGCKGVRIVYYGTRLSKDHPCWYDYDSEYGYHEVYDIIAWMPLPTPWKESEE